MNHIPNENEDRNTVAHLALEMLLRNLNGDTRLENPYPLVSVSVIVHERLTEEPRPERTRMLTFSADVVDDDGGWCIDGYSGTAQLWSDDTAPTPITEFPIEEHETNAFFGALQGERLIVNYLNTLETVKQKAKVIRGWFGGLFELEDLAHWMYQRVHESK
jgi:hypothetical protein